MELGGTTLLCRHQQAPTERRKKTPAPQDTSYGADHRHVKGGQRSLQIAREEIGTPVVVLQFS